MSAIFSISGNIARINLSGEFDFSSQEDLKQAFDRALEASANEIYVDMKNTIFIDSAVIRLFLKLHETAKRHKKSLTIMNCNDRILEILSIGGFDQVFNIR